MAGGSRAKSGLLVAIHVQKIGIGWWYVKVGWKCCVTASQDEFEWGKTKKKWFLTFTLRKRQQRSPRQCQCLGRQLEHLLFQEMLEDIDRQRFSMFHCTARIILQQDVLWISLNRSVFRAPRKDWLHVNCWGAEFCLTAKEQFPKKAPPAVPNVETVAPRTGSLKWLASSVLWLKISHATGRGAVRFWCTTLLIPLYSCACRLQATMCSRRDAFMSVGVLSRFSSRKA